jgi:RND family efflux transporter MFP subunit
VHDATPAHGEGEVFDPAPHRPTGHSFAWVGLGAAIVFGGLLVAGVVPRVLRERTLAADERQAAIDVAKVRAAKAYRTTPKGPLNLPGSVQPLQETPIYARANGYVRRWLVDIGAVVKKGQVLVELDVPDIDEQLRQAIASAKQAEAGIAQAKAQRELARTTNDRYKALGPSGVVSQQEVEQYRAGFEAQDANVAAAEAAYVSAQATVHRYEDLRSFAIITAPFDGVVTMRAVEVGQLVMTGTAQGAAMFKIAEVDVVRVFVNVPQLYAAGIVVGMDAPTTIREAPGRIFPGKVVRTAHELDVATRTLLVEVDIPNPDGALFSGMYAQVGFKVDRQDRPVLVPATSVLFDALGTRAAILDRGVVHWSDVRIEDDMGDRIAVATGVDEGQLVAINPSEHLIEGMKVDVEERNPDGTPETPPGGKSPTEKHP